MESEMAQSLRRQAALSEYVALLQEAQEYVREAFKNDLVPNELEDYLAIVDEVVTQLSVVNQLAKELTILAELLEF